MDLNDIVFWLKIIAGLFLTMSLLIGLLERRK